MAKEEKKASSDTYKAVNPKQFKEWYGEDTPYYKDLSEGKSTKLDMKLPCVQDWLNNKIIVKE